MNIKKISAWILAGAISCMSPVMIYAEETQEVIDYAAEIIKDSEIDSLLSDPDKVADIIVYVKDVIGEQEVTDDQLYEVIHMAEEYFQIEINDSEEESVIKLFKKFKDMDIDEEKLREKIHNVYDKLESLGLTEDDVKGIFGQIVDFVKNILE